MDSDGVWKFGERHIAAWNTQVVADLVDCYTEDLVYLDPNTRGPVNGAHAMGRYLTRLFGRWQMHWTIKDIFPFADPADGLRGPLARLIRTCGSRGVGGGGRDGSRPSRRRQGQAQRGLLRPGRAGPAARRRSCAGRRRLAACASIRVGHGP